MHVLKLQALTALMYFAIISEQVKIKVTGKVKQKIKQ